MPHVIPVLSWHTSEAVCSGLDAALKGILETPYEITVVAAPPVGILEGWMAPAQDRLLRHHLEAIGCLWTAPPTGARAIELARVASLGGAMGVAIIPASEIDAAMDALARVAGDSGDLVLIIEDDPLTSKSPSPRRIAQRFGWPVIVAESVQTMIATVRDSVACAAACRGPVVLDVHRRLFQQADVIAMGPNRGAKISDLPVGVRHRRKRLIEEREPIGVARRFELNRVTGLPSPGEESPLGIITVGSMSAITSAAMESLGVSGTVPVLHLGMSSPVDRAILQRLCDRCRDIIVIESRPGEVQSSLKEHGHSSTTFWGSILPPDSTGVAGEGLTSPCVTHPSSLAAALSDALEHAGLDLSSRCERSPGASDPPQQIPPRSRELSEDGEADFLRFFAQEIAAELGEGEERAPASVVLDGIVCACDGEKITVETWGHDRFVRESMAAIPHAIGSDQPWIMVVGQRDHPGAIDLERLARVAASGREGDRYRITVASAQEIDRVVEAARAIVADQGVLIAIVTRPGRDDLETVQEIDRAGYRSRQVLTWPADRACVIRQDPADSEEELRTSRREDSVRTRFHSVRREQEPMGFRLSIRPLIQQVVVVRSSPPSRRASRSGTSSLATPSPRHGQRGRWRAHLAGLRGDAPSLAANVLIEAGRAMGYRVQVGWDETPVAPGMSAWTQLLLTRPVQKGHTTAELPWIPFGEADLLVGLDRWETVRAIAPVGGLKVASPSATSAILNTGVLESELDLEESATHWEPLATYIRAHLYDVPVLETDLLGFCRHRFHNERLADMVMLGAAFQAGEIPVTVDAMEHAISVVEASGSPRTREAFETGRAVAADSALLKRTPVGRIQDDVRRLIRRRHLLLARTGRNGRRVAPQFTAIITAAIEAMPGLTATAAGEQASRDFVVAAGRALLVGGIEEVKTYVSLITALYRSDREDRGYALTYRAILPLAEAMLIRDPIAVATIANSQEVKLRLHRRLNVRKSSGDQLETRYLLRIRGRLFHWDVQADIRTGNWVTRLLAAMHTIVPRTWRGRNDDHRRREIVIDAIRRATQESEKAYDHWFDVIDTLQGWALSGQLREKSLDELIGAELVGRQPAQPD